MNWNRHERKPFWLQAFKLLGHLAITAFVFVAVFTFGWLVSFCFNYLDGVHKFPDEITKVVTRLEVGLFYIDLAVSGIVLLAGLLNFMKEAWRES